MIHDPQHDRLRLRERATEWGTLACEVRAVNHRFLELGVRLPEELRVLEPRCVSAWRARVARQAGPGAAPALANGSDALQVDEALVATSWATWRRTGRAVPATARAVHRPAAVPGVLQARGVDGEALQREALALLDA
jgi:uncharacterized protein YicC (UPF0701 family)